MKLLLAILLALSVAGNIILYLDDSCQINIGISGVCRTETIDSLVYKLDTSICSSDSMRFKIKNPAMTAELISAADARNKINSFFPENENEHVLPFRGMFISKLGLNAIFLKDPTATGVNVYIGKNDTKYYLITVAGHNPDYGINMTPAPDPSGHPTISNPPIIIQNDNCCPEHCDGLYTN